MSAKPIIVIRPDVATEAMKQVLRRAGYAVIVSDAPAAFTVLDPAPIAPVGLVLRAALKAIQKSGAGYTKESFTHFGTELAQALLAASEGVRP